MGHETGLRRRRRWNGAARPATPDDAYRYAKGDPLYHAGGFQVRLTGGSLGFLAVTDHAEYLGAFSSMGEAGGPLSEIDLAEQVRLDARRAEGVEGLAIPHNPIKGSVNGRVAVEAANVTDEQEVIGINRGNGQPLPGVFAFQNPREFRGQIGVEF